jgi:hypothetical protein
LCPACGADVLADDHALQTEGDVYHARCVLKGRGS